MMKYLILLAIIAIATAQSPGCIRLYKRSNRRVSRQLCGTATFRSFFRSGGWNDNVGRICVGRGATYKLWQHARNTGRSKTFKSGCHNLGWWATHVSGVQRIMCRARTTVKCTRRRVGPYYKMVRRKVRRYRNVRYIRSKIIKYRKRVCRQRWRTETYYIPYRSSKVIRVPRTVRRFRNKVIRARRRVPLRKSRRVRKVRTWIHRYTRKYRVKYTVKKVKRVAYNKRSVCYRTRTRRRWRYAYRLVPARCSRRVPRLRRRYRTQMVRRTRIRRVPTNRFYYTGKANCWKRKYRNVPYSVLVKIRVPYMQRYYVNVRYPCKKRQRYRSYYTQRYVQKYGCTKRRYKYVRYNVTRYRTVTRKFAVRRYKYYYVTKYYTSYVMRYYRKTIRVPYYHRYYVNKRIVVYRRRRRTRRVRAGVYFSYVWARRRQNVVAVRRSYYYSYKVVRVNNYRYVRQCRRVTVRRC